MRVLVIGTLMLIASGIAGNPVSVPLGHPVYEYIDRMETLGIIVDVLDGAKPYSRGRVAGLLLQVRERRDQLTAIDARRLAEFLLDFRFETGAGRYEKMEPESDWYSPLSSMQHIKNDFNDFFSQRWPQEENHVFSWEKDSSNFYLDFIHTTTFERRSDTKMYRLGNWQTYRFRSLLEGNFGMALEVSLIGLRGDSLYAIEHPILKNTFAQTKDDRPTFGDRSGGELAWHTRYFDIAFAQQEVEWGHGESGKLILSSYVEQYPYLQLSRDWGWGKFTFLHGKLQGAASGDSILGAPIYPDKWLAAQRLEFSPWDALTIGLNESFIYGNRYADWSYMIPFNFLRAVQHNLRDRDNATISVDFEWVAYPGSKLYGTAFLDEFRQSKLFTNWYGNKHAFLIGMVQEDPFGLANTSVRLEYTAIMPWVYTHRYRINTYTSDSRPLGHWAGPNSQVIYAHIRKDWHARLRTGIRLQQYKHGNNYHDENIGGDILHGYLDLLGDQKERRTTREFLEGILYTEQLTDLYAVYEPFNEFFVHAGIRLLSENSAGSKSDYNEVYFGFRLDY
jgi:hypothetical protein